VSQPLSQCVIFRAALGDEQAYKFVLDAMRYNKKCGHYSVFPCTCDPPCRRPTEEQGDELNRRIAEATKDIVRDDPIFCDGCVLHEGCGGMVKAEKENKIPSDCPMRGKPGVPTTEGK